MESHEQLEKALNRLMPSALSDRGQRAMESAIDSLAGGKPVAAPVAKGSWWPLAIGMPAAAAAAFAVAISLPRGEGDGGERPVADAGVPPAPVPAPHETMDFADMPMKVFDIARRTAEFEWRDGALLLAYRSGVAHITVKSPDGGTIYEGPLDSPEAPELWKSRGESLKSDLLRKMEMGGVMPAIE